MAAVAMADFEERPAKKRRFFAEESPVSDHTFDPEPSLPDEVNALPEDFGDRLKKEEPEDDSPVEPSSELGPVEGFDTVLFTSIVGEQVPGKVIRKLQQASDNDVQRGTYIGISQEACPDTVLSYQHVSRRLMERIRHSIASKTST